MSTYHILLVEDAPDILSYNRRRLQSEGYLVSTASTLKEARRVLAESQPDLIVLDILLPDGSGLDLCIDLRAKTLAPVLFLSSLGENEQVIRGLRAGGDDYMVKPYRFEELLARIEAQLRRMEMIRGAVIKQDCSGSLTLEPERQRACWEGRDLLLKPKEYQLLVLLLRNRNRFSTAKELYAVIWGMSVGEDIRTVTVHISGLRKKLRKGSGDRANIDCSRTRGYRLELEEEGPAGGCHG